MDDAHPQRGPGPGRTWLRMADRVWELDDSQWETYVRSGWVPPEALVLSLNWTRGVWRRAGSLEVYHLFVPSPRSEGEAVPPGLGGAAGVGSAGGEALRRTGLPTALWGPGISITQALVLVNLIVSATLVALWRDHYTDQLWALSGRLRAQLFQGRIPVLLLPLFLHASSGHLLGNMFGLTAAGAAVEEFYGRTRTILLYLAAGLGGAALSLLREKPVLSVGASGAIMGLYGVTLVFLARYRRRFSQRQRWKTTRVYFPLLVLALLPSLFMADFYSHLGGFLTGIFLAILIRPRKERLGLLSATETIPEIQGEGRP
jgi:membrane associated rhomboid family serine protease